VEVEVVELLVVMAAVVEVVQADCSIEPVFQFQLLFHIQ
jgi:hypothetical protein